MIRIGVLFSQSGPMAVSEKAHLQGIILACDEINAGGGIDGRLIEPVIVDPAGDDRRYAELATELLVRHKVNAIFGCCLSSSRKAVVPVVERFNGILFYPSVYEGFEYSPNVIYGGAVPNQVIVPLLEYIFAERGKTIALAGSDTLYAREINRIVGEFVADSGGAVLETRYFDFGAPEDQFAAFLQQVIDGGANAVVSTVVGEDTIRFYEAFARTDRPRDGIPIASLTTTESELARMSAAARSGHLSAMPYFGSLDGQRNQQFAEIFRKRFGASCHPGVYPAVCYSLVHIFADAVRQSRGSTDSDELLAALSGAVFKGPGGDTFIDVDTNHFAFRPLVGQSTGSGEFKIVWRGTNIVRPDPYLVGYDRSLSKAVAT